MSAERRLRRSLKSDFKLSNSRDDNETLYCPIRTIISHGEYDTRSWNNISPEYSGMTVKSITPIYIGGNVPFMMIGSNLVLVSTLPETSIIFGLPIYHVGNFLIQFINGHPVRVNPLS